MDDSRRKPVRRSQRNLNKHTRQVKKKHSRESSSSSESLSDDTFNVEDTNSSFSSEEEDIHSSERRLVNLNALRSLSYPTENKRKRTANWVEENCKRMSGTNKKKIESGAVICVVCHHESKSVESVVRHHQHLHRGLQRCPMCPVILQRNTVYKHLKRHYMGKVTNT